MNRADVTAMAFGLLMAVAQFTAEEVYAAPPAPKVDRARSEHVVRLYVNTKKCMRSAGRASYARGADAEDTLFMMLSVCGGPLRTYIISDMGADVADTTLIRIAWSSYYGDVLGIEEPPLTLN